MSAIHQRIVLMLGKWVLSASDYSGFTFILRCSSLLECCWNAYFGVSCQGIGKDSVREELQIAF